MPKRPQTLDARQAAVIRTQTRLERVEEPTPGRGTHPPLARPRTWEERQARQIRVSDGPATPRWPEWLSVLRGLAGDIDVFLAVSDRTFYDMVVELRASMRDALNLARAACTSIENLSLALEQIRLPFIEQLEQLERQVDLVAQASQWAPARTGLIRSLFSDLRSTQGELETVAQALSGLGVTVVTRVTRCPEAIDERHQGLEMLRARARQLAGLTASMREQSFALYTGLEFVTQAVDADRRRGASAVTEMLTTLRSSIVMLSTAQEVAHTTALEVSFQAECISQSIEGIICNAQFQDITTQRLQHIRESLIMLAECVRDQHRERGDHSGLSPVLLLLQREQLLDAKGEYELALDGLVDQLAAIEGDVLAVAERLGRLSLDAGSGQAMLFDDLRGRLVLLLDAVRAASRHDRSLATRFLDLEPRAQGVRDLVGEVLELSEIFGDTTRRTLTGCAAGRPCCGKLSQVLLEQVSAVLEVTDPVADKLAKLMDRAREMAEMGPNSGAIRDTSGVLERLMNTLMVTATEAARDHREEIYRLRGDAVRLARRLAVSMLSFGVQRRFEGLANQFVTSLKGLESEVTQARGGLPNLLEDDLAFVDGCARTYTMKAERKVLARVLRHSVGSVDWAADDASFRNHRVTEEHAPTTREQSHDLGSNVELF